MGDTRQCKSMFFANFYYLLHIPALKSFRHLEKSMRLLGNNGRGKRSITFPIFYRAVDFVFNLRVARIAKDRTVAEGALSELHLPTEVGNDFPVCKQVRHCIG